MTRGEHNSSIFKLTTYKLALSHFGSQFQW